jgi:hypothetical protein
MVLGVLTGWLDRRERDAVAYLIEENRLLRRPLGGRRLHLTDEPAAAAVCRLSQRAGPDTHAHAGANKTNLRGIAECPGSTSRLRSAGDVGRAQRERVRISRASSSSMAFARSLAHAVSGSGTGEFTAKVVRHPSDTPEPRHQRPRWLPCG